MIEADLPAFKEESYSILAKARIYCGPKAVYLYNQFLTTFFNTGGIYDGVLVDTELIPTIRKDLGTDEY